MKSNYRASQAMQWNIVKAKDRSEQDCIEEVQDQENRELTKDQVLRHLK